MTDTADADRTAGVLASLGAVYDHFLTTSPRGGLHHITFKVPDIDLALREVRAAGYHPVGTNLAHAAWRET